MLVVFHPTFAANTNISFGHNFAALFKVPFCKLQIFFLDMFFLLVKIKTTLQALS